MYALLVALCVSSGIAAAAGGTRYVVTNDDVPPRSPTSVSFFTIELDGQLTAKGTLLTGGVGIAGGFFGANRIAMLNDESQKCVYASEATSGDIVGVILPNVRVGGRAKGSLTDTGASSGIGLALNSQFLYASFTDANTIGTFQVLPGCGLLFINDISVGGLQGGTIDAMSLHGNMLVTTYADGSIESFDVSGGVPLSNGDLQNSTGANSATYPGGIDITQDGHFAIFGDVATSTIVEVSDISSGRLAPTVVYHLGGGISSSNVLLSPDETILYISNTQGDRLTAAFFDNNTGQLSPGCISGPLRGYVSGWSYLGALASQKTTGTGGAVYVAEFGAPSSIGVIDVKVQDGRCQLREAASSPVADPVSPGLLSIGTFPPRQF